MLQDANLLMKPEAFNSLMTPEAFNKEYMGVFENVGAYRIPDDFRLGFAYKEHMYQEEDRMHERAMHSVRFCDACQNCPNFEVKLEQNAARLEKQFLSRCSGSTCDKIRPEDVKRLEEMPGGRTLEVVKRPVIKYVNDVPAFRQSNPWKHQIVPLPEPKVEPEPELEHQEWGMFS